MCQQMKDPAIVRDIQAHLSSKSVSHRRPGDSPYPLDFPSNDDINFDIWDHLFFVDRHCQRLTVHQFDSPPSTILDLGCGTGFWAIQAAKQWTTASIIGYDMLPIQPDLNKLDMHQDVADRIEWVHGNFLDGLPFRHDYFEFVHISKIGLGVPEDEWQSLLEEVARVLKSTGVLEIIEEDAIFPCCPTPRPDKGFPASSLQDVASSCSSLRGISSDSITPCHSKPIDPVTKPSQLGKATQSDASFAECRRSSDSLTNRTEPLGALSQISIDHTRLKLAWEALLLNRFLPLNLLSVLPFYLSTSFMKVQAHPHLNIPLPSNSDLSESHDDVELNLKEVIPDLSLKQLGSSAEQFTMLTASASTMHLARRVNIIKSCKDAIWREYVALFASNKLPDVRTINKNLVQHVFDTDWQNWLNDMEDRTGTRSYLASQLLWEPPLGNKPEWEMWRQQLDAELIPKLDTDIPVCRSIRTFVAWKS